MVIKKKKKVSVKTKPVTKNKAKVKNKTEAKKIESKPKTIKILNKEIDYKTYFEYYTLVIFFLFAILFIFIIVIFFLAVFGSKYLWTVIPITLGFWGLSYYLSKKIFKSTKKK